MKKTKISLVLSASLLAMATGANASEFDGGYFGLKAGLNQAHESGTTVVPTQNSATYGLEAGYGWDVTGVLLGVDGFVDANRGKSQGVSSEAYGLDVKAGVPLGRFMPYAKIGFAAVDGTNTGAYFNGMNAHAALGLEYKLAKNWSVGAEWNTSAPSDQGAKFRNDNFVIGLNYYFGKPAAPAPAQEVVAPVEPPPVKETHTEPPPKATPEQWKTVLTETPVTIEGANFAFDSDRLLPGADERLEKVLKAANEYPNMKMEVDGHTDSVGKRAYNQKLSERRAKSVKAWLVKHGVAADRVMTAGYADTKPVADNKTKAGRAKNRRVDVHYLIREEKRVRVQ